MQCSSYSTYFHCWPNIISLRPVHTWTPMDARGTRGRWTWGCAPHYLLAADHGCRAQRSRLWARCSQFDCGGRLFIPCRFCKSIALFQGLLIWQTVNLTFQFLSNATDSLVRTTISHKLRDVTNLILYVCTDNTVWFIRLPYGSSGSCISLNVSIKWNWRNGTFVSRH